MSAPATTWTGPVFLGASLVALAIGPLLHRIAERARSALVALDGFVFVAIGGLVLGQVLPRCIEMAGLSTLLAALGGLLGPLFIERWLHGAARQAHAAALALGLTGIVLHAFIDGMALDPSAGQSVALPLAVLLHRVPEALTVWMLLRPSYGRRVAVGTLALLGTATFLGYTTGEPLVGGYANPIMGYVQALVSGSLLHVMIHRPHPVTTESGSRWWASGVGGLIGLGLVFGIMWSHPLLHGGHAHEHGGGEPSLLLTMALESAPALLLAYLTSGLVHAFLPRAGAGWVGRGGALSQAVRGVVFGLPLPMCSCGVIPVYRSLVLQGVPAAAAMAFFVATPELGLDALFLSVPLLGGQMTLIRIVCAVTVALFVGVLVGRLASRLHVHGVAGAVGQAPRPESLGERLREAGRVGFGEMVDATLPWILLGLALASVLEPFFRGPTLGLSSLPDSVEVVVFALLGMPIYVCASGATPLVAVLLTYGVSPGAAMAFLITGPATNVTTFGVLSTLHGRRIALLFAAAIAAISVTLGILTNLVLPSVALPPLDDLHVRSGAVHALQIACLAAIGLLFAASLLRQGPRRFVAQILVVDDTDDEHEHQHEHGHEHEHGR